MEHTAPALIHQPSALLEGDGLHRYRLLVQPRLHEPQSGLCCRGGLGLVAQQIMERAFQFQVLEVCLGSLTLLMPQKRSTR